MKHILLLTLLSLSFLAQSQTVDSLKIGSGGGFSGQVQVTKITKGQALKGAGLVQIQYNSKACLKKKQYKQLEQIAEGLFSKTDGFDHPHNTNKFIEIYSKGQSKRYVWGDPSFTPPQEVLDLYNQANQLIASLKFKSK